MQASIAKNTAYMTLASVSQKVISFVYFTIVARAIGVAGTGKYFFALSFTTIFVVFIDLGFTQVLIREAAKSIDRLQSYVESVFFVKMCTGAIAYAAVVIAINALGYPEETKYLVYLSGVTMIFDSIHLTLYGIMRSLGDLRFESAGIICSQFITMTLGTIFLYFHFPIIFLILAYTVPSFINVCFIGIIISRFHRIRLCPKYSPEIFWPMARLTVPFALAAIFARVYSYADSLLLSRLSGDMAVGWYSIPYKITYAFQFIPLALVAAVYPRFSEYYAADKDKLSFVFERSIIYLFIVAAPIVVGINILAKEIILSIYTDAYLPSVVPLKILIAGLLFSFVSFPIGAFLNACRRQTVQTAIVGSVMATNIFLNIFLIPRYGATGAAIAAGIGNIFLTSAGLFFVPRIANVSFYRIIQALGRIALSAAVMGLAVFIVKDRAHFIIAIISGALVYFIMLFATRSVTRNDITNALALVSRK